MIASIWSLAGLATPRPMALAPREPLGGAAIARDHLALSGEAAPGPLVNPSFEAGAEAWRGVNELSVPTGWDFAYAAPDAPWLDGQVAPYGRPETRVLARADLPTSEHAAYIVDGDHTYKIFADSRPVAWRMSQRVGGLVPGATYRMTVAVNPDLVAGYGPGGKVFSPDPWGGEVRLSVGAGEAGWGDTGWLNGHDVPFGETTTVGVTFVAQGTEATIAIAGRAKWGIKNNGWFVDDARLAQVAPAPDAPPVASPSAPPAADPAPFAAELAELRLRLRLLELELAALIAMAGPPPAPWRLPG